MAKKQVKVDNCLEKRKQEIFEIFSSAGVIGFEDINRRLEGDLLKVSRRIYISMIAYGEDQYRKGYEEGLKAQKKQYMKLVKENKKKAHN